MRTRTSVYQRGRTDNFSENFTHVLNGWYLEKNDTRNNK